MTTARSSEMRYGIVAVMLHWLIAAAIIFMLGLGIYMTGLPTGSMAQFEYFQLHKSVGISILLLSLIRIGWRLINPIPPLAAGLKPWERVAARVTHYGFYVLMIAMPLTGWIVVSVSPLAIPTMLFGAIPWPDMPFTATVENPKEAAESFSQVHEILAFAMIALLLLHIAAALKHHFILKDDVMRRMRLW